MRVQGWRGVSSSIVRDVGIAALRLSEVSVVMSVMAARARSATVAWRRGSKSRNAGAIFGGRLMVCRCKCGTFPDHAPLCEWDMGMVDCNVTTEEAVCMCKAVRLCCEILQVNSKCSRMCTWTWAGETGFG